METIIYIFLLLVIIICSIGIFYIVLYNKIQNIKIRIDESENIIDNSLRKRYDLIIVAESIIKESIDINLDSFNEIKELKSKKISNFDFDRKSLKCVNLIIQIKKDYSSLEKNQSFKDTVQELKNLEEKVEASKSFYNKYTSQFNTLVRKFPSNIISRIHHLKEKKYFDNKDMTDEDIDDFKV